MIIRRTPITAATALGALALSLLLGGCTSASGGSHDAAAAPASAVPSSPTASASSLSGVPGADDYQRGVKVAAAVALTPADWGAGFVEGQPYEIPGTTYEVPDASCKNVVADTPVTLTGGMVRSVKLPEPGTDAARAVGYTDVRVHVSAAGAQKDFGDAKAGWKRCPTLTEGQDGAVHTLTNIHETSAPTIAADEIFAVEGLNSGAAEGADAPYCSLLARVGGAVLEATVKGSPGSESALRARAETAMNAMIAKVKAA